MRGLIYKDLYAAWKYCKAYLLMITIFAAVSIVEQNMSFYSIYPCIFVGTVAVSLLSYDERDKWLSYGAALPVSRKELVSAKYVVSLIIQCVVLLLVGAAQCVRVVLDPGYTLGDVWIMVTVMVIISFVIPALMMPWMFKLGTEKGRIVYLVTLGIAAAVVVLVLLRVNVAEQVSGGAWQWAAIGIAPVVYAASWLLSVRFFEKRDL